MEENSITLIEDSDTNSSENDLSSDSQDQEPVKILPKRATRGTRVTELVGEEAEADEQFWGQSAWNEDDDDKYSTEEEEEDIVDDDFDEEEQPDEEIHDEEQDKEQRSRPKKKSVYQEPYKAKKKVQAKHATTENVAIKYTSPWYESVPRILRATTTKKSTEIADRQKKQVQPDLPSTKSKVVVRLSQAELLREAIKTEWENTKSLSRLERIEEEKKANITPKAPFSDRLIRYHSRIGIPSTVTFVDSRDFPKIFNQKPPRKRKASANTKKKKKEEAK